jgi:hypothetical protein
MCDFDHKCQMGSYIEALGIFGLSEPILYFCGQKKFKTKFIMGIKDKVFLINFSIILLNFEKNSATNFRKLREKTNKKLKMSCF